MGLEDMPLDQAEYQAWRPPSTGGGDWTDEVPEPDDYVAVVAGIWDIGIQRGYMGALKHQVCVLFELDAQDSTGAPFTVHQKMTFSMYEKAPLYRLVCACFPNEKHLNMSLHDLVGKSVYVTVDVHTSKSGKRFPRIDGDVKKLPRGMAAIAVQGDYSQPTGLVKWMRAQAVSREEADAEVASTPTENATRDASVDEDIPF